LTPFKADKAEFEGFFSAAAAAAEDKHRKIMDSNGRRRKTFVKGGRALFTSGIK